MHTLLCHNTAGSAPRGAQRRLPVLPRDNTGCGVGCLSLSYGSRLWWNHALNAWETGPEADLVRLQEPRHL